MLQYKYKSYADYVKAQKAGYRKKRDRVWAVEDNIKAICGYMSPRKFGICHGVRGGQEMDWFRKYSGAVVIGSEIGETNQPHSVQWDFNVYNPKWEGAFDFVYSNAFDHAYDPESTLRIWWEQLRSGGVLIIETDERNEHTGEVSKKVNPTDPTGITFEELRDLIERVTGVSADIIDLPVITYGYRSAVAARKL